MRILSLVVSLVVTVSLAGAVLTYLEGRIGRQRIQVQDHWLSAPEQSQAYRGYGEPEKPDTARIALRDSTR